MTGGQYTYDRVTRYDADGWLDDLASLQQGRRMHGCSQFSDNYGYLRAIVAGGYDQSHQTLSSSEMFDYSSNEWEVISSLPVAVFGLTGVTLNNKPVMTGIGLKNIVLLNTSKYFIFQVVKVKMEVSSVRCLS